MLHQEAVEPRTLDILKELMKMEELQHFALAGGTALALQLGHRKSIDLDFFSTPELGLYNVNQTLYALQEKYADISRISVVEKAGFLFCYIGNLKVDFIRYNAPLIKPIVRIDGIRLFALEDIAAMKINAVTGRGAKKDFWDYAILLEIFTLSQMLSFFQTKYKNHELFHVLKSLTYFEEADKEEDPERLNNLSWESVKEKTLQSARAYYKNMRQ